MSVYTNRSDPAYTQAIDVHHWLTERMVASMLTFIPNPGLVALFKNELYYIEKEFIYEE